MPIFPSIILPKNILTALKRPASDIRVSPLLLEAASASVSGVPDKLQTTANGLSEEEAEARLAQHGPNVVAHEHRHGKLILLGKAMINPLVILLLVLAAVSFLTADNRAGTVMSMMVVLGVVLRFVQESRADAGADTGSRGHRETGGWRHDSRRSSAHIREGSVHHPGQPDRRIAAH